MAKTVTQMIQEGIKHPASEAERRMWALVHQQVEAEAHHLLQKYRGGTLQTGDLLTTAYEKLRLRMDKENLPIFENRNHFYVYLSKVMINILKERARKRKAEKRGGGLQQVLLNEDTFLMEETDEGYDETYYVALEDGLDKLAKMNPKQAEVVRLRNILLLTIEQTASTLGLDQRDGRPKSKDAATKAVQRLQTSAFVFLKDYITAQTS